VHWPPSCPGARRGRFHLPGALGLSFGNASPFHRDPRRVPAPVPASWIR
jgi:hypothetical protein